MSSGVSLTAPIQPHEIPKPMRDGLTDIVRRVSASAAFEGQGHDLLLRIYLAGVHHGLLLGIERATPDTAIDPQRVGQRG